MPFVIMKRANAHRAGLKKYYTGRPCAKGHDTQRWTGSGICCVCARDSVKKYNAKMRGGDASFMVRCHKDDEESIRQFVAGIAAIRDARAAEAINRTGDVQSPFAAELASAAKDGYMAPAFLPRTKP